MLRLGDKPKKKHLNRSFKCFFEGAIFLSIKLNF